MTPGRRIGAGDHARTCSSLSVPGLTVFTLRIWARDTGITFRVTCPLLRNHTHNCFTTTRCM